MSQSLNRRTFLRGLLGGAAVSIALPPLEAFMNVNGTAYASSDSAFPKRFGVFSWGNGIHPQHWIPSSSGMDWEAPLHLQPFANVKEYLTLITGMEVKHANLVAHSSGPAGFLGGCKLAGSERVGGYDFPVFNRPSIDQILAQQIGGDTRFRSIEVAVEPGTRGLSYISPDIRNPPESNPILFFERLFGTGFRVPGDDPIIDPTLALRRSVLDSVMQDITKLNQRLGSKDQARVDQHLTAIRDLELRIARIESDPPNLAACAKPEVPTIPPDIDGRVQMTERSRLMSDMVVMAYACDLSRIINYTHCDLLSNNLFPGATSGFHQLTHDEPGDMPQFQEITLSIMHDFAYFLEQLAAVPEGDTTLLDNCIILGTTDVSYARTHQIDEYPILLAGSGGGAISSGFHYRSDTKENASHVPFSLLQAMDANVASFGEGEGYVTSGLSVLEP